MKTSTIYNHMNGRLAVKRGPAQIGPDAKITQDDLRAVGYDIRNMDGVLTGGGSGGVPGYVSRHVLETWLSGTLRMLTAVRNIDEIVGISTVGRWEDEAIRLRMIESAGDPLMYGDDTPVPFADIRTTAESRGIVRFELGFQVGRLEDVRLGASGYQAANEKRRAVQESLDTARNRIGFNGFNSSLTNVYGLLNDPSLPAYAGSQPWLTATYAQLVTEFTAMVNQIEQQSGGHLQDSTNLVLAIPTGYREIFNKENSLGRTFRQWLNDNYPNTRVVTTPELVDVNGTVDGAYLFIENAGQFDDSDVEASSMIQAVPVREYVIGSENQIKGYVEDLGMATAGVFVLRPWAFARRNISA